MRGKLASVTALLFVAAPFAAGIELSLDDVVGAKRYIVGFYDAIPSDVDRGAYFYGARVVELDQDLVYALVEARDPPLFEARAKLDERVRYIEWDDPAYARLWFVPNDARYGDSGHYGSKIIGGEAAWDVTRGSTAVKVAMIDSGLNRGHEEYSGQSRVLQGWDFHNGDSDPNDESACSWHGTHTTGTAGATINNARGIAGMSQHTILPIKGLGGFGCGGGTTALANALKYARDQGAHISSNSWGGGTSTAIADAIEYAHAGGVIHIAAAGNSGSCTNCVSEPWKSKASKVIIVSSTTSSDTFSSFSSEGPEVDVSAPGSSILSTTSGTTGYGSLSGTSMATPHVSGTAALVKAVKPTFTFADMESCLRGTAKDLGPAGFDNRFGAGRIQANLAVNCGGGSTPPPPPPPSGQTRVYFENFDGGTASGWTKSSSTDIWHLETGCVTNYSGGYKLAWTRASYCNYATGSRVTGWAQTGAISLSGKTQATVKFVHQYETESYTGGAYDILRVQISRDGVSWTTLQQWDSRNPNILSWTGQSYAVDSYAGGTIYLRFWTDTVDSSANNYRGWFVDNVEVTAA